MTPGNDRQDLVETSSPLRGRTDLAIRRRKMYVASNLTRLRLLLGFLGNMIFKKLSHVFTLANGGLGNADVQFPLAYMQETES